MWAARAAAEQAERTARQRLNKMLQNNDAAEDNDEQPMEDPIRFDELLRGFIVDNLLPLAIWLVEVIVCIAVLAILSVASYGVLYWGVIMRGLEVQSRPIFFDYNPGIPGQSEQVLPPIIGTVDLKSPKRAPWSYSCRSSPVEDSLCVRIDDDILQNSNTDKLTEEDDDSCLSKLSDSAARTECPQAMKSSDIQPILLPGQRYFFEVTLTLPESEINKRLGMFMVTVDLRSSDKQLLASSKQSSMLPFESNMIAIFRKLLLLLPLSAGLLAETRTVTLLSFDNYVDISSKQPLSYVEVTLKVPNPASFSSTLQSIQIQGSKLRFGKEMSPLQEFFRSMRWPCAFLGTTFFFMVYAYAALSVWRRRASRIRWNSQPYAEFFSDDDNDESAVNSKSGSDDRWMGAEVEIIEEECNDSDKWEALDERNNENKVNEDSAEKKKEKIDQVVSDEEEDSVTSADQNVAEGTTKTSCKSTFPNGRVASKVKGRSNGSSQKPSCGPHGLGQKPSREDEERSLADMVMKGYRKYEVFTGEQSEKNTGFDTHIKCLFDN